MLPQMTRFFPKKIKTFVDLFAGGLDVAINIHADTVYCNDINHHVIGIYEAFQNMTIGELAKSCGTSVATISRFCRKCDVEGFHQLKIQLAKEIVESGLETPVSNHISRTDIGQSL